MQFEEIIKTFFFCTLIILLLYYILNSIKYKQRATSSLIPYLGNGTWSATKSFFGGISFPDHVKGVYNQMAEEARKINRPVLGFGVDLGVPTLSLGDPELIKAMLVSDFPVFENRRDYKIAKKDKLIRQMLFSMRGEEWKTWRSKLSPMMASMKVKRIFTVFDNSSQKLVKYIQDQMGGNSTAEIDGSLAVKKFSMDVIVATTIGSDSGALAQADRTIFEKMGDKMHVHFDGIQFLKLMVVLMAPKVADLFGVSMVPLDGQRWWSGMLREKLRERLKRGSDEKRVDFVQMLLEGKASGELEEVLDSEEEIERLIANSIQLLLGGLDTMISGLAFALYALATNPDVQSKVREEVEIAGDLNSDSIGAMSYLDMFLNESLRMFPPAWVTDRMANVDYKVPGTDFVVKAGELISIPIYGIHHDPLNFENPHIFNPLRFEHKEKIGRFTYLPFGAGPRGCIATRFAPLQLKTAIAHLVKNFKIEPSSKTQIPIQFSNGDVLKSKKPIILNFTKL